MSFSWKVRAVSRRLQTYFISTITATSVYDLAFKEIVTLMDRDKNAHWLRSEEYNKMAKSNWW
eukprot:UN07523